MNPFKPAPLPNPLPDLTIEQAQAALDGSVAGKPNDHDAELHRLIQNAVAAMKELNEYMTSRKEKEHE